MKELKFNSQICTTKEQSQRLLDLGLKHETADMSHQYIEAEWSWFIIPCNWNNCIISEDTIPAWSLHRLLEMYVERYISCNVNLKELTFDWLIDEIGIHITENDFNKEYLKQ